jgi:tetratricopeptide (TPR) repeat protein
MKRYILLALFLLIGLASNLRAHLSPDDSLDQIELKLKGKPNDVSLLLDKAHVLLIMDQWEKGEATLKRVDELQNERDADTTYLYILLYHKRGDLKKAFEISDGGIQQFPENHFQWEIRGRISKDAGKTEEAINAMTQSLRTRKTVNSLNYIQIINILLERNQAGDKERTLALLQGGIERVDNPSELLHLSIRLNSELERYDQALENINQLEAHYGKQVPFAVKRAAVLEEAGRNAEAAKVYRSAIALLEALPEKKQNKQVTHLEKVFQMAVDELSEMPDGQQVADQQVEPR